MPSKPPFLPGLDAHAEKARRILGVLAGAFVVASGISWLLDFASRFHWVLAAMLAALFVVAAVWLTHQVKRSSRHADFSGVLGVLALGLLVVMVVCAWVSFTLHVSGLGKYSGPTAYSPGTFVDLYMYTFLDLLPGIEVLKTLNLKAPIESRDLVSGLPILAFKLFVVWLFFDAFLSWRKSRQEARTGP